MGILTRTDTIDEAFHNVLINLAGHGIHVVESTSDVLVVGGMVDYDRVLFRSNMAEA